MHENYHSNLRHDIVPYIQPCDRLLDVGGGTGVTARYLKREGLAREVGVLDAVAPLDDAELDFASRVDIENHAALDQFLGENGPFETILFLDVLEHLIDPWSALDVFARHVAQGGTMIASVPNIRHISVTKNLLLKGQWDYQDAGLLDRTHLRFFVRETAERLMARPGMQVEKVEAAPVHHAKHRLADRLTLGRLRGLFTLRYYVVARKLADSSPGAGSPEPGSGE